MKNENNFDIIISSNKEIPKPTINNLTEMIFKELPQRDENCFVILSHDKEKFVKISLKRLRFIISFLIQEFEKKDISPGDTALLSTMSTNSELFVSLMFISLITYGIRVLFPMYVETSELDRWIKNAKCKVVILPEKEILSHTKHEKEKQIVKEIRNICSKRKIMFYDLFEDFTTKSYLYDQIPKQFSAMDNILVKKAIAGNDLTTESVIFTTSGSSGKSKLVLYEQGAFIRNCNSWQESNMFKKDKMGGRSFIDILPHSISVRALFNAIWTGFPVCIVSSNWIKQKPEKILPFLLKMKPENMTIGPSSFNLVLEFIKIIPELRNAVFSDLKTVVSTGAPFNEKTAEDVKNILGLYLHNAYGTTETQQVLTTVLYDQNELDQQDMSMGKPLNGIEIGLKKISNDTYRLFVKSPFGHKSIIGNDTVLPDEFFYSGDIVKLGENNRLIYIGRENRDFVKSGFGAKTPISSMKEYYKRLYNQAVHIEYYPTGRFNFSLGIAALIFIENKTIPHGRVTNKKMIKRYYKLIKKINNSLLRTLEPFEFEHRTITRFLLINSGVFTTFKGTISKYKIKEQYKDEINDILYSNKTNSGVKNFITLNFFIFNLLFKFPPLRNSRFRKIFLNFFLRLNR
jgi:long-subunit acyl-CoA synthetase (AMP-forming)